VGHVAAPEGGIGSGNIVPRDHDYMAPVGSHFGNNSVPEAFEKPCDAIGGCSLCDPTKIVYIDELDEEDNVVNRLANTEEQRAKGLLKPEVQWYGDGYVALTVFLPADETTAQYAGLEIARRMGLKDAEVIHKLVVHPAEGTLVELKGIVDFTVDPSKLVIPAKADVLSEEEIRADIQGRPMKVIAATVGEDEHSVGMREIIDIKHGGIEKFGVECHYLGTSVSLEKVVNAAIEVDADAILVSTIITHADIHRKNMKRLHELCIEKGIRDRVTVIGGGTQVTNDMAVECGLDAGFGRGTKGVHVASFLVKKRRERK